MVIPEFLARHNIVLDLEALNKTALIQALADKAAADLELQSPPVVKAILDREALGSTGTGDGVAVPHARIVHVKRPIGVFARLKRPVPFDSIDGLPVDLVFLLLSPIGAKDSRYLSALAAVARLFRDSSKRQALRQTTSPDEILRILQS